MSGLYLPGMEMPTEETVIVIYKLKGKFYASMHRGELYPLIPVPDHGDLIDRDAAIAACIASPKLYGYSDEGRKITDIYDAIVATPTIIPKSGGAEDE